jgi:ABC-type Zn uptake system ZnuABC Zn-binding protein ZnuA
MTDDGMRAPGWVAALSAVGLLVAGCAAQEEPEAPTARPDGGSLDVVASMSIIADFAEQVGGEAVTVTSLVPIGADPHVHEPTPADARAVADADLVLGNGVGLEPWFDDLVAGSGQEVITVTEELAHLVVDDEDGEDDPHLWMVPPMAAAYVERIAEVLAELDPERAETYHDNAAGYVERLEELDDELAGELEPIPEEHRILVTPHDAYSYFADHYGFEVATVVGVSTEEEPSASQVQHLIDVVRETGVPTVFVESTVNPAVIERIADDAGVEVGAPLYGDSVGEPGSGAEDYLGMMRANVAALVEGLAR